MRIRDSLWLSVSENIFFFYHECILSSTFPVIVIFGGMVLMNVNNLNFLAMM